MSRDQSSWSQEFQLELPSLQLHQQEMFVRPPLQLQLPEQEALQIAASQYFGAFSQEESALATGVCRLKPRIKLMVVAAPNIRRPSFFFHISNSFHG